MSRSAFLALTLIAASFATQASAEDYSITLKDHAFSPANLQVPANEKFKLTVKNEQKAGAEFESDDLNREKVVAAGSEVIINLGPLKPGTYTYKDDFHEEAKGTITVK